LARSRPVFRHHFRAAYVAHRVADSSTQQKREMIATYCIVILLAAAGIVTLRSINQDIEQLKKH